MAINTVPTGLLLLASGPATPVTDNPISAPEVLRIPSAMASATSSLTAPYFRIRVGETSKRLFFASLLYATTPSRK